MTATDQPPRRCAAASASVVQVARPCREHVRIECAVRDFAEPLPGQFAQLLCRDPDPAEPRELTWSDNAPSLLSGADWRECSAYLRRPFSIADAWRDRDGLAHLVFISRAVGVGTGWLDRLRPGDTLNLTGPLGRGFDLPALPRPLLLVGGGVGIPPLLLLSRRLAQMAWRDVVAIFGAASADLLPVPLLAEPDGRGAATRCIELPGGAAFPAIVTTDDGTLGLRGRVTDALRAWVETAGEAAGGAVVMACGPEGMLAALSRQTRELGLACQLCIERQMGCGLGTCLSCVVRVRDASRPAGWRWALSCTEGPVFERDALYDYD